MCGICGILRVRAQAPIPELGELRRVSAAMAQRGPDGEGEWFDPEAGIALGHRRLAILDLSSAGAQPMSSRDGRFRIVFNGEIYNFRTLRAELEQDGVELRSSSDTEVVLRLWEREGSASLARLRGMFALAVWDGARHALTLARDPFGIKPLYYAESNGTFRFASQVRALEAGGALSQAVSPPGLVGFLLWGSVPEPWTIRADVRAVPAGHVLEVIEDRVGEPRRLPAPAPAAGPYPESAEAAVIESVRHHLVSDVPVAVFLSAGLDSTMIAAVAARELGSALTSFTLSFEGWQGSARDEGPLAARVAARLGTRHVERKLTRSDLAAAWPAVIAAMDQPSIDGFNSFLVARAAREAGIRVALSGLGGDELCGSYPSFRDVPSWSHRARILSRIPGAASAWPTLARAAARRRPKLTGLIRYGGSLAGAYFLRRGLFLPEEATALIGDDLAREGLGALAPIESIERELAAPAAWWEPETPGKDWDGVQRMEVGQYLRNQLLRDTDWAAMASSVEVRTPLVDAPLWRSLSRRGFEPARTFGKAALARRVAPELPEELWNRPKTGFGVPVAEWMLPPDDRSRDTLGRGSRRLACRILEELNLCVVR